MRIEPDMLAYLQLLESKVNDVLAKTSGGAGGIFFQQGGNSFGAAAVLGTNDANQLRIQANSVIRVALAPNGAVALGTGTGNIGTQIGNSFDIEGTAASTIQTTSSNLTIQSVTSGTIAIAGISGVRVSSSASQTEIDGAGANNTLLLGDGTHGITLGTAALGGTGTIGIAHTASVGITAGTSLTLGAIAAAAQLTGGTTLALAANGGAASLDATAAVNIGASNATSIVLGNGPNTASITIAGTAALTSGSASATGGVAIPATCEEFIVITFRGNTRKIAAFAS